MQGYLSQIPQGDSPLQPHKGGQGRRQAVHHPHQDVGRLRVPGDLLQEGLVLFEEAAAAAADHLAIIFLEDIPGEVATEVGKGGQAGVAHVREALDRAEDEATGRGLEGGGGGLAKCEDVLASHLAEALELVAMPSEQEPLDGVGEVAGDLAVVDHVLQEQVHHSLQAAGLHVQDNCPSLQIFPARY